VLQIAHIWTNDHNRALVFVRLISLPHISRGGEDQRLAAFVAEEAGLLGIAAE
jgi:hypothetical protein